MLIGISGPMGAGKSTLAGVLTRDHLFTAMKMAHPLKSMLTTLLMAAGVDFPTIRRKIEGDLKEVHCPVLRATPRHAMQTLGTEWGRKQMGDDFWVRMAGHAITNGPKNIVIDDIRFENEAAMVRQLGGKVVGVIRPGTAPVAASHVSEQGVTPDFVLVNDGTPDDMCQALIQRLGK